MLGLPSLSGRIYRWGAAIIYLVSSVDSDFILSYEFYGRNSPTLASKPSLINQTQFSSLNGRVKYHHFHYSTIRPARRIASSDSHSGSYKSLQQQNKTLAIPITDLWECVSTRNGRDRDAADSIAKRERTARPRKIQSFSHLSLTFILIIRCKIRSPSMGGMVMVSACLIGLFSPSRQYCHVRVEWEGRQVYTGLAFPRRPGFSSMRGVGPPGVVE